MKLVATDLVELFHQAGWTPERRIELRAPLPADHPAAQILVAFAGLRVGETGSGVDCATSDIHFTQKIGEPSELSMLAQLLGEPLIPIAETHHAHGILSIGKSGRCFGASLIDETIWLEGDSFEDAIRSLTTGLRVRPILLPGQESVVLYGETYTSGDPRFYDLGSFRREVD